MAGLMNGNLGRLDETLGTIEISKSEIIVGLAIERNDVSNRLEDLYKNIEANPETVSIRQKDLQHMQAKAMQEYFDVLGLRIKDLIDSDTMHSAENLKIRFSKYPRNI